MMMIMNVGLIDLFHLAALLDWIGLEQENTN